MFNPTKGNIKQQSLTYPLPSFPSYSFSAILVSSMSHNTLCVKYFKANSLRHHTFFSDNSECLSSR